MFDPSGSHGVAISYHPATCFLVASVAQSEPKKKHIYRKNMGATLFRDKTNPKKKAGDWRAKSIKKRHFFRRYECRAMWASPMQYGLKAEYSDEIAVFLQTGIPPVAWRCCTGGLKSNLATCTHELRKSEYTPNITPSMVLATSRGKIASNKSTKPTWNRKQPRYLKRLFSRGANGNTTLWDPLSAASNICCTTELNSSWADLF